MERRKALGNVFYVLFELENSSPRSKKELEPLPPSSLTFDTFAFVLFILRLSLAPRFETFSFKSVNRSYFRGILLLLIRSEAKKLCIV